MLWIWSTSSGRGEDFYTVHPTKERRLDGKASPEHGCSAYSTRREFLVERIKDVEDRQGRYRGELPHTVMWRDCWNGGKFSADSFKSTNDTIQIAHSGDGVSIWPSGAEGMRGRRRSLLLRGSWQFCSIVSG